MPKIGLALSGGAARGIAHIGIIKALEEFGIKPGIISGVSVGSIVGAYYAAGYQANEIFKIAASTKMYRITDLRLTQGGIFKPTALQTDLEFHFKNLTFEKLKLPLTVCATDFINCKPVFFSEGELVPVLLGSSAMPAFYEPVEYRNMTILEGGLTNNLPVEPLLNNCDIIIASHVNPLNAECKKLSIANVIDRSFHIAVSESMKQKKTMCHLFIEPPLLSKFGILDMDDAENIFKTGYDYAISQKKQVEKLF